MSTLDSASADRGQVAANIAFLIDYDGTIATIDVTDELVRASSSESAWLELEQSYRAGAIGTRALLEAEARLLPVDPSSLRDVLRAQGHDPTFTPFVTAARGFGAMIEIVSDGLGFFVAPAVAALGVGEIPVYTAAMTFGAGEPRITFPAGNPDCSVCGTCKRARVLAQQATGRHVVFVGDGFSDQYAVAYADTVFAKGHLVDICRDRGIAYEPWSTFDDVGAWLGRRIADGGVIGPRRRPFICGPETTRASGRSDDSVG